MMEPKVYDWLRTTCRHNICRECAAKLWVDPPYKCCICRAEQPGSFIRQMGIKQPIPEMERASDIRVVMDVDVMSTVVTSRIVSEMLDAVLAEFT
jgi:hypothetical protein